ncbi:ThiJ family intracellular protease [gut metagenome]|uniref:ThiJ family intracellular protease n=1 Tax=gut metagenome TaxID=749906 RepID=J9FA99_9ZZZZ
MLYIFLATGFEETEALGTLDILRRIGLSAQTVSITGDRCVMGAHQVPVIADILIEDVKIEESECLILPGGLPGSQYLLECASLRDLLLQQFGAGKRVAAICAGPMVLGAHGILQGKQATCYPGFEDRMIGATPVNAKVVVDGNVITGKGPGAVFDFGFAIAEQFAGKEAVAALKKAMIWN